MTFSIVAADPATGEVGCAVASKFLAVGAAVPWVRAGRGAIATQALANLSYGPGGLQLLEPGVPASAVVERLTGADAGRDDRQLGIVTPHGDAATFTGSACLAWAGGRAGPTYAAQGNILVGPEVVDAMVDAYTSATGGLVDRLYAALAAGDAAGGDSRGRQGAAIVVCEEGAGYGGTNDRKLDLRVDDHPDPVRELRRLMDIHELLFGTTPEEEWLPIDRPLAARLRNALAARGYDPGRGPTFDRHLEEALKAYVGTENLEERWYGGARIDPRVVAHLEG